MGPTISISNKDDESYHSKEKKVPKIKKETIFLFDWDDTLMCTHFINLKNQNLTEDEQYIVNNLGKVVWKFLKKCSEYGKIIIMTNSSEEWMKKTAVNFLKINEKMFENIKIISTRDKYLKKGIEKKKWKEIALNELLLKYGDKIENLVCASDSEKDIEVFKNISKENKEINISTIKFKSKPSPLIMIKEIKYLSNFLYETIGSNKNYYLIKEKPKNDDFNYSFGSLFDYIFPN
jgi:HD superfamily phosphohydrolase